LHLIRIAVWSKLHSPVIGVRFPVDICPWITSFIHFIEQTLAGAEIIPIRIKFIERADRSTSIVFHLSLLSTGFKRLICKGDHISVSLVEQRNLHGISGFQSLRNLLPTLCISSINKILTSQ